MKSMSSINGLIDNSGMYSRSIRIWCWISDLFASKRDLGDGTRL